MNGSSINHGLMKNVHIKKGYQPRMNVVKDEKGDVVTDFHCILARWRNHFCQLLRVVNDVRQTEIQTGEPHVPNEPIAFEVKIAKLKRHKSAFIDEILTELIQAGG
jgi:hypothetical protein